MSSTAAIQPAGVPAPPCADLEPQFDHERFDVYRVATRLFYLIARGSAMESAAVLDVSCRVE